MTHSDYDRAAGFANAAMALLRRAQVPPYPIYYELFYTYAAGSEPELNRRMNEVLSTGTMTVEQASELCEAFLNIEDVDSKLRTMSSAMSDKITDVNKAIDFAMATANSYSGSLQQASGDLDRGIDEDTLKILSARLLKETRRMQDMNRKLETQLENSRDDISVLQRDLDEVRRESMLDPLTKIPNRKCFDEHLALEMERARTEGHPLSLLVFDIDHFKVFNDTYGHLTGDQVLRLVAQVLKANLKGRDLPARFGGEEFVAILPETNLAGAMAIADTIRRSVQSKELLKRSTTEKLGRITLSGGVSLMRTTDIAASLIERADHCLYAAKNAGRNQIVSETQLSESIDVA